MKIKKYIIGSILVAASLSSACTINVNPPGTNANNANVTPRSGDTSSPATGTNEQKRWSVVVCSSRAKTVTLSAGTGENDGEVFATWQEGAARRKFDLPVHLQNLSKIYLKGSASDNNQVEMCVLYDDKPKKRVEFDDNEDVMVSLTDVDELDKCRCSG